MKVFNLIAHVLPRTPAETKPLAVFSLLRTMVPQIELADSLTALLSEMSEIPYQMVLRNALYVQEDQSNEDIDLLCFAAFMATQKLNSYGIEDTKLIEGDVVEVDVSESQYKVVFTIEDLTAKYAAEDYSSPKPSYFIFCNLRNPNVSGEVAEYPEELPEEGIDE